MHKYILDELRFLNLSHAMSNLMQVVVEKKIMREKQLTRHDLGREKFISEACFINNLCTHSS
jgi:valyl-tRNA synthetase